MAKKRKSTKKAKPVKKAPKKVAKKKQNIKTKSKPKGKPKAKPKMSIKSKHKEEFKIFLFLAAAVFLLVLLAKNNVDESSADGPFILPDSVTTEQVGETNTYIFYYTVVNPTQELVECNIIVEIRDEPYVNTITMEPGEEVTAKTEVEMPDGENPIKVYAEC